MNACLLFLCMQLGAPSGPQPDRLFGEDKLKHFFASFLVTSLAASGARAAGLDAETSLWVGAGTGAAIGIRKELQDRRGTGTVSAFDLAWDAAGVGAATVIVAQTR